MSSDGCGGGSVETEGVSGTEVDEVTILQTGVVVDPSTETPSVAPMQLK